MTVDYVRGHHMDTALGLGDLLINYRYRDTTK